MSFQTAGEPARSEPKDHGTLALVLGIISLFVFGLILGLPAIFLGFRSPSVRGKIGGVLGVIAVIAWAVYLFARR
jgi:uncharacterized membrane protein